MTPRAFPRCECAAGYEIDPKGKFFQTNDGVRILPVTDEAIADHKWVPDGENFKYAATYERRAYRIPKGAWEIAFEVDE